jgi:hypothetical protein
MPDLKHLILQQYHGDSWERTEAREQLEQLPAVNSDVLIDLYRTGDVSFRQALPRALPLITSETARPKVLALTIRDSDPSVLAGACWALEGLRFDRADLWEHVSKLLTHDTWYVRQAAVNAVGSCDRPDSELLDAIRDCINDPNWRVRSELARVLPRVSEWNETVAYLLDRLLKDPEWAVRGGAVNAVRSLKPELEVVRESLLSLLADQDWGVRIEACHAIETYGTAAAFAIPALQMNANVSAWPELRDVAQRVLSRFEE